MSVIHLDKLGQPLKQGDIVAFPYQNRLQIGRIVKINAKMLRVEKVEKKKKWEPVGWNKYPEDAVKIEGPQVTMYLLKTLGE